MMKKLRWQLLVVLLALAAIAVLLIGQQPTRLPGVLAPSEAPAQGGVYTEALIGFLTVSIRSWIITTPQTTMSIP